MLMLQASKQSGVILFHVTTCQMLLQSCEWKKQHPDVNEQRNAVLKNQTPFFTLVYHTSLGEFCL